MAELTDNEELQLLALIRHPGWRVWMNLLNERKEALEQQIDAEVKNSLSERANKYDFLNILSSHLWELNKIIFLVDGLVKENILDKSLFQKDKNSMQEIEKMQGM